MSLNTQRFSITPVMSATPDYSAGDCIGTKMLIKDDFFAVKKTQELVSAFARDSANVGPDFTVYLFNVEPTGTVTDNAAFAPSAGDIAGLVCQFSFVNANYKPLGTAIKSAFLPDPLRKIGTGIDTLWAVVVADGAYNGATTSNLTVDFFTG